MEKRGSEAKKSKKLKDNESDNNDNKLACMKDKRVSREADVIFCSDTAILRINYHCCQMICDWSTSSKVVAILRINNCC